MGKKHCPDINRLLLCSWLVVIPWSIVLKLININNRLGTHCVETLRTTALVQREGGLSPRPLGSRNNLSCFQYRKKKLHNTVVSKCLWSRAFLWQSCSYRGQVTKKSFTKPRTLQSLISAYNQPASSFCWSKENLVTSAPSPLTQLRKFAQLFSLEYFIL